MRIRAKLAAGAILAATTLMLTPGVASAHEEADIGPIHMAVGFGTEPDAYAGLPNSVQLLVSKNGEAVLDLGDSLKVTIRFGDQTSDPTTLEPAFEIGELGTPGDYRAYFVPSQAGDYTFHFTGSVDGTTIDKSFTSGPKTFSTVKDLSGATFPRVQAPTNADLATRVDQESARTASDIDTVAAGAQEAFDAAGTAKAVGIAGIAVGALGLIVGAVALVAARKRA